MDNCSIIGSHFKEGLTFKYGSMNQIEIKERGSYFIAYTFTKLYLGRKWKISFVLNYYSTTLLVIFTRKP